MKKREIIISIVAASIITAAITSYGVVKAVMSKNVTKTIEYVSGGAGAHFTSYDREKYPDLTYAAENAVQTVVNIEKTEEIQGYSRGGRNPLLELFGIGVPEQYQEQQPQLRERRSGGSGVIISSDGYIVTNNHVIENASKLRVRLNDDRVFEGKVIGTDPTTDVALIKIDATQLPALPYGDSDQLRLGEWVLAIGSPFDLQSTVTAGIVSAKARDLGVIPNQLRIESFIQTDAAVNPGNSGGALVNVKGELVGINTVIKSPTGSFAGYSFAIPVSIVQKVVYDLKEYGVVQRAIIGISFRAIDDKFIEEFGEQYNIKESGGVYVFDVDPDGAAAAAGIKTGDIITEINGHPIKSSSVVLEEIARNRPGDTVKLSIKRGGEVKHFNVVLRNMVGKAELLKRDHVNASETLGGTFADISSEAKKELKIEGGVLVMSITEGGILSKARIKKGYVITHINEKEIRSVRELVKISGKIGSIDGIYPNGRSASYVLVE